MSNLIGFLIGAYIGVTVVIAYKAAKTYLRQSRRSDSYMELYPETAAETRLTARRALTAYAWPVWAVTAVCRAVRDMHAAAYTPQDKP